MSVPIGVGSYVLSQGTAYYGRLQSGWEYPGSYIYLGFLLLFGFRGLLSSELLCGPLFTLTPPRATPTGVLKNSFSWDATREVGKRLTNEFGT